MHDRFPILTWHSINVLENTYAGSDLIAFAEDLQLLDSLGWTMLPLQTALDQLAHGKLPSRTVALTADDGSRMDFEEFDHPTCGPQNSMVGLMREFLSATDHRRHQLHLSCFVIASPEARAELDRTDYMDLDVWPDRWWRLANESGLISIENHSWDHNHGSLARTVQRENRRGDFRWIETFEECRAEVDQASDYIETTSGRRPAFFAYPYGQASDYIRFDYLPRRGPDIGLKAALGCEPEPVTLASDPWHLPRYVCGRDWKSPEELASLLRNL